MDDEYKLMEADKLRRAAREGITECDRVIKHLKKGYVLDKNQPEGSETNALYLADGPHWHQARVAYIQVLLQLKGDIKWL